MEERQALLSFAALSQETRLGIIRTLVVAGPKGMAAGSIAEAMAVSPSNVSFHLKELERAGLIAQRRESRSIVYSANYDTLSGLVKFLMEDCCAGHPSLRALLNEDDGCCPSSSATEDESA
ncbi:MULTISPECIES: metalloregulator ArsR/SmtB family transcription factor [unclassified Ensifer]|uniref:ArsR/SmtB family transcription factor n=1 Tax=unclassified Ensifer TaxID=2633371 RepID=UPI000812CC27|nr:MULTISPECIES: metalloregulator ArsR/SmtB family transcription factor [unclassified Ensifer]OCO98890.1 transcriptional regulator [Ensifer sp. LC14]OCP04423.1 transcriptional regulator [Ensifer sp. LC11]OCP04704.1 transcriptional regulator [Ensifer sp. LC13]OCP30528.1 transcriptional regulator [Ensifer sp. LC499]